MLPPLAGRVDVAEPLERAEELLCKNDGRNIAALAVAASVQTAVAVSTAVTTAAATARPRQMSPIVPR